MYPQARNSGGTITSWLGVFLLASLGVWMWSQRNKDETPVEAHRETVVLWDGVWMRSKAILRIRQKGAGLKGEFSPSGIVCRLTGRSFAEYGMFSATIDGKAWRFRMTPEEHGMRLVGWRDPNGVLDEPRGPVVVASRTMTERIQDDARDREDRREAGVRKDFGVFERAE